MKNKISALFLCAIMIFSILAMSSCYLLNDGVVEGLLSDSDGDKNITIEGGDTNSITITGAENSEMLAASKGLLSSVSIRCKFEAQRLTGKGNETYYAEGSGVIYKLDKTKGDAYIITNYHVINDEQANSKISKEINVSLYGQSNCICEECCPDQTSKVSRYSMKAEYVGGSERYDIAVLKITDNVHLMASNAVAANFANSNEVAVLEKVVAIGTPGGNAISATVGHINVDSEFIDFDGNRDLEFRVMRTDAAVNSGNSGGGLFNVEGDVIGIVNAKLTNDTVENIGYVIPSNIAKSVAESIIYYCDGKETTHPKKIALGIYLAHTDIKSEYDTETGKVHLVETVYVDKYDDETHVRGLLKIGDVINSATIDGVTYKITRDFHIMDCMLNARENSKVIINVTRNGQTIDVEIPINDSMLEEIE